MKRSTHQEIESDSKIMGYIQDLEKELREELGHMDAEQLVKYFKDKVLESYRNGLKAGKATRGSRRASTPRVKDDGQA